MVLVPWDRDQPGVARRAQRLGIAVVIQRDDLSNEALGHAVEHVLQDSYYSDRARKRAACEPETLASSRASLSSNCKRHIFALTLSSAEVLG